MQRSLHALMLYATAAHAIHLLNLPHEFPCRHHTQGLLDNERFALMYVRGRWRTSQRAPAQIARVRATFNTWDVGWEAGPDGRCPLQLPSHDGLERLGLSRCDATAPVGTLTDAHARPQTPAGQELRQKGVEEQHVRAALEEVFGPGGKLQQQESFYEEEEEEEEEEDEDEEEEGERKDKGGDAQRQEQSEGRED